MFVDGTDDYENGHREAEDDETDGLEANATILAVHINPTEYK